MARCEVVKASPAAGCSLITPLLSQRLRLQQQQQQRNSSRI